MRRRRKKGEKANVYAIAIFPLFSIPNYLPPPEKRSLRRTDHHQLIYKTLAPHSSNPFSKKKKHSKMGGAPSFYIPLYTLHNLSKNKTENATRMNEQRYKMKCQIQTYSNRIDTSD